jgi:hypothetical protein
MIHVYPLNDLKEHDTSNKGNTCDCNPKIVIKDYHEILVVHNSYDGREVVEFANEILNKEL